MHRNTPRTFSRRQARENAAFLAALAHTGNARLAARDLGVHRSTFTKRRARSAAFAAEWDGALAVAQARLNAKNPPRLVGKGDRPKGGGGAKRHRSRCDTTGAPPHLVRLANGALQLRDTRTRRIDCEARQAFLAALSATANVRLSARAAGFAHSSFYRLRDHDPAFAREMRMALQMGYDRIEMALIASSEPDSYRDDAWRSNELPEIPPMNAAQALQLLYLHQKEARLWYERPDRRRRRGEDTPTYSARLGRKWRAEQEAQREDEALVRAMREAGPVPEHLEPPRPMLPALEQVTGWSKARPEHEGARPANADGAEAAARPALFGGWRLQDWQERK